MGNDTPPEAAVEENESAPEAVEEAQSPKVANSTGSAGGNLDGLAPKMEIKGTVKRIELQGAIIDIGSDRTGLLHISQLSEKSVKNVSDVVNEGDEISAYILAVDKGKGRVDLTLIKPPDVTWQELETGQNYTGQVVRIEKFGVFVDIGAERPGLIHVSELAAGFVKNPEDVVSNGQTVEVKLIGMNRRKKQIDLSIRALEETTANDEYDVEDEVEEELPTAMELALRRAMGSDAPESSKQKRRKKKSRGSAQEDILARTLKMHTD